MSAEVVDLALFRARRASKLLAADPSSKSHDPYPQSTTSPEPSTLKSQFLFWTGASGTRYVHSIYNLFECPPVQTANYILVKRHSDGHRTVVSIGRAANTADTINLAEIRFRSAQLGANEVHVHLLADNSMQSLQIEADLRGSLVTA